MIAGLIQTCGRAIGAARGVTKAMLGQNPNSPFNLVNLLHQFYSPGGGGSGAARSEGQSDNRASSITDSISRMASMQSARQPPPR